MFTLLHIILLCSLACFLLPAAVCLILCKRLNFQFQKLGLFSVTGIAYNNDQWAITIDTIKVRFSQSKTAAQPVKSGAFNTPSEAWLTFHFSGVHVRYIGPMKHSSSTVSRSTMIRRLVTYAVKLITSMPIQLALVGFAEYAAAQLDNVTFETRTSWKIRFDSLYFRSSLFTSNASGSHLCPYSIKRTEHLFWRRKVFKISVVMGSVRLTNEKKTLVTSSSHQKATLQCHLGTGCVTLTNIDFEMHIDTMQIKLDPLLHLSKFRPSSLGIYGTTVALKLLHLTTRRRCNGIHQNQYESRLEFDQLSWSAEKSTLLTMTKAEVSLDLSHPAQPLGREKTDDHLIQVAIRLYQPNLFIDVARLQRNQSMDNQPITPDIPQPQTTFRSFSPRPFTLSLAVSSPSIQFVSPDYPQIRGSWDWDQLQLGLAGGFTHEKAVKATESSSQSTTAHTSNARGGLRRRYEKILHRTSGKQKLKTITGLLYSIEARMTLDGTSIDTTNEGKKLLHPILSIQRIGYTSCIRMTAPNSKVTISDKGSFQYTEANLVIESPTIKALDIRRIPEIDFWKSLVQPSCNVSKPAEKSTVPPWEWVQLLNLQVTLKKVCLEIASIDYGLRGTRKVPDNYIDNAPVKDVVGHIFCTVDEIFFGFSGYSSNCRGQPRFELPSPTSARIKTDLGAEALNRTKSLGILQFSLDQLAVVQTLQSTAEKHDKSSQTSEQNVMAWVSRFHSTLNLGASDMAISVTTRSMIKKCAFAYSINNHYAGLLAFKTMHTMLQHFQSCRSTVMLKNENPITVIVQRLQLQIHRTDVRITLPGETQIYCRMDDMKVDFDEQVEHMKYYPAISVINLALFGTCPQEEKCWSLLLEMNEIDVHLEKRNDTPTCKMSLNSLYVRVPHGYIFADVLDNSISHFKTLKELHGRLSNPDNYFTYFGPIPRSTLITLPNISLNCKIISIQAEDDPFEVKLRRIFKTAKKTSEQAETERLRQSETTDEQTLRKEYAQRSRNWIKSVNTTISKEETYYKEIRLAEYRQRCIEQNLDTLYDECNHSDFTAATTLFSIDMTPLSLCPPLSDLTITHVSLELCDPKLSEKDARLFVNDLGKGMPVDFDFSFLFPFHLALTAGETWIQIRDYPLPLLHIPPVSHSAMPNAVAWSVDADYVFADELGNKAGSRRVAVRLTRDYTLDAIRTVSPLKFYSTVSYTINSKGLSKICWSKSYQPVIQDIAGIFDSLTPSPVDPSPKLGLWDKYRFLIHTRTCFTFEKGEFALVMKGTHDPYQLLGRGAGVTKLWRGHVVWSLGYVNPQKEFIQVKSDEYIFGVPNLIHEDFQRASTLVEKANNLTDVDYKRFQKRGIKLSNVQMGIRGSLERVCSQTCTSCLGSRCRMSNFLPHYAVQMKSPQNVDLKQDAFQGFRANFIHLAISIVQQSLDTNDSGNTQHSGLMSISPRFREHFFVWFGLFSDKISYPVRHGPLYQTVVPRHNSQIYESQMATLKFKIVIEPFAISYFYRDEVDADQKERRDLAGLKAQIGSFKVDIHQRRIVQRIFDKHLENGRVVSSWPIHEMEIQLSNVDMRVVKAQMGVNTNNDPCDDEWIDHDDYFDLDESDSDLHSLVSFESLPLAFSPCIYYLKQLDHEHIQRKTHQQDTHECIMGTAMETHEMQMVLVERQIAKVDKNIEELECLLANLEINLSEKEQDTDLICEITETTDAKAFLIERRKMLLRCVKEMRRRSMPNLPGILSSDDNSAANSSQEDGGGIYNKIPLPLSDWEEMLGHFKQRCIVHNPQIIWSPSLQNAVFLWRCLRAYDRIQSFNKSNRAVQFLQDLTAQQKGRSQSSSAKSAGYGDANVDTKMTEDLIEKLLAATDRTVNIEAPTTPDDVSIKTGNDNVNDPSYQQQSIPSGYSMQSDTLIDLLNPQVNLYADGCNDQAILIVGERMQVKMFEIFDMENPDATDLNRLVKKRTIVSTENAQLFVTKRMRGPFDHLQTEQQYGNIGKDSWPLWLPTGVLIDDEYHRSSEKFQRIGNHLTGTIQHDRCNPLRITTKLSSLSEFQSFEDRCDDIRINIPRLALAANSFQYNVVYTICSKLLLTIELPKNQKRRTDRMNELMLTADSRDLVETTKNAIQLHAQTQRLARLLECIRKDNNIHEIQAIRREQADNLEKLHLAIEVIKLVRNRYKPKDAEAEDRRTSQTNMKFEFKAQQLDWEMLMEQDAPFSHCTFAHIHYQLEGTKDNVYSHILQVEKLHVKNTSDTPVFTEVLSPFIDSRNSKPSSPDFSRQKMLRVYYVSIPPVGGIKVIQHFEINLFPLKVQLSHDYGKTLMAYLFPTDNSVDGPNIVTGLSQSYSADIPTASECNSLAVADKQVFDVNEGIASGESDFGKKNLASDETRKLTTGGRITVVRGWIRDGVTRKSRKTESEDQIGVMKMRASQRRAYIVIKIPGAGHCVSYQGPNEKTIYNLRDFRFRQPDLEYRNKTWSAEELIGALKKDFRVAILKHSPAFLKQKLGLRRRNSSSSLALSDTQQNSVAEESKARDTETQPPPTDSNIPYIAPQELTDSTDEESVGTNDQDYLDEDAISLYSNDSNSSGIVMVGHENSSGYAPTTASQQSKSASIISRLIPHRKAPVLPSDSASFAPRRKHQRSISSGSLYSANSMEDTEELKTKGRLLLGKAYVGPTSKAITTDSQLLSTGSAFKEKQRTSSSNSLLSFFNNGGGTSQ